MEERILKFWQKNRIFEKTLSQRKNCAIFSFYDGPPFATGKPHYGHILATTIKDTVLRYWTMKGYYVPRRVGWDCHGLPIENLIEKELGIKNKKEIEKFGIEKFNQSCKNSVFRCVKDFEATLKRVGRWADYKNTYATLSADYIESVWWVFQQLWRQGLVYKDYRVSPYCPRCGTSLSNFEVNQGYKDITETSIYLKFKIKNLKFKNSYLLVWTTTPWTLPGNVALAIHPTADYFLIKQGKENYVLAKKRRSILSGEYQIIEKLKGRDLIGLKYEPLFNCFNQSPENIANAFQILPADFVSVEEGTGIVHTAVMYGDDDFQLGKKFNLPMRHTVDESGLFKKEVSQWAGEFVKKADPKIVEDLNRRGLLYKKQDITHTYPFCWRCDSPLLYYALKSWYINIKKIKKELIENNKKILWVPAHIKKGRFGEWLKEARDWAFSRNRFWGAPIPIWQCQDNQCNNIKVIGSIKELIQLSKKRLKDFHRPYIDEITFKCEKCGGEMKRIPEVFDCWFESGSMPYAQWHYPFENKKLVEKTFPADFIAEGLDQTRGWFYTLHVIGSCLTLKDIGLGKNQTAFKNVIVNGMILDSQGRKLSKRLRNYPEPAEIFNHYGADSLRYFLLTSTPIGEDYRFSSKGVEEAWRKIISTLWHSYLFFNTYKPQEFRPKKNFKPDDLLNKWIISRTNRLNQELTIWMDQYELTKAARLFDSFIDDLSNWYIRRSRQKFQRPQTKKELRESSETLGFTLLTLAKLMAPFTPFLSEEVYKKLHRENGLRSVHLEDWPRVNKRLINKKLEEKMEKVREVVASALAERAKAGIKVRQPLSKLKIKNEKLKINEELIDLIKEEVNVKEIVFDPKIEKEVWLDTEITTELKEEGMAREVIRQIQEMRKKAGLKPKDKISIQYFGAPELNKILAKNKPFILRETKAKDFRPAKKPTGQEKKIDQQKLWLAIKKIK